MRDVKDYTFPEGTHTGWTGPRSFGKPTTAPRLSNRLAQAIVWEERHGAIPEGMGVKETCDYRYCLTPDHIDIVPIDQAKRGNTPTTTPAPASSPSDSRALARIEAKLDQLLNYFVDGPVD